MMAYSDDHIALAAEYALGTLDADERALVETMMIVDHGFKAMVEAWSLKLAPLHQMVAPVEPPISVWDQIAASPDFTRVQTSAALPEEKPVPALASVSVSAPASALVSGISPHPVAAPAMPKDQPALPGEDKSGSGAASPDVAYAEEMAATVVASSTDHVEAPARHRSAAVGRGGYGFGFAMTAVAAALAAVLALQLYRPELLPEPIRVKPKVQIVEVPAPAPSKAAQLVAVLQQNAAEPAFLLTVDPASKSFTARRVGAPALSGRNYELWIVSDKLQRPRSLGVIADNGFTTRGVLADYDTDMINRAVYAITVERQGGSNGVPTANPIYAGKLVESVPGKAR